MENKPRSDTNQPPKKKQRSEAYLNYQRYIRSKKFKAVREAVLERDGHRCQFCNRTAEETQLCCHHRTYEHLFEGGEAEIADCITLCSTDHKALHSVKRNYKQFSKKTPKNSTADNGQNDTKTAFLQP